VWSSVWAGVDCGKLPLACKAAARLYVRGESEFDTVRMRVKVTRECWRTCMGGEVDAVLGCLTRDQSIVSSSLLGMQFAVVYIHTRKSHQLPPNQL
jgi:hypothetical protein